MREQFDDYIGRLKRAFEKNPSKVNNELYHVLKRVEENADSAGKSIFKEVNFEIIFIGIMVFATILIGFFNFKALPAYLGGLIFFYAGLLIGKYVKGFGLIFLFSHGGTGYALMIGSLLYDVFSNPLLQDNPNNFIVYFIILLLIIAIATILSIIYNLSDTAKGLWQFQYLPLTLFVIVLFLCGYFPRMMEFIYRL